MRTNLTDRVDGLRAGRTPYVLATVVRAQRPTSAKAGDCALVLSDGTIEGFVGGVCAESTVRLHGLRLLRTGQSTLLRITPVADPTDPTADGAADGAETDGEGLVTVGNPCLSGGTLDIFLEAVIPPPLVHVFGDAPVARAMATVGAALGYAVRATVDPLAAIPPDAAAVVVASHGRDEEPVLTAALAGGTGYVGLVASRRRGSAVLAGLDVPAADRTRVRTPAGLDIGARTAAEVALSVFAEIILDRTRPPDPADPAIGQIADPADPGWDPNADETLDEGVPPGTDRAVARPAGGGRPGHVSADPVSTEALDPVCGMTVAVSPASLRAEHDGRTWYFCGPGCRHAFVDDPGRYAR
ncbi:MAG TPA: XdhC family protein [Mycobacteriales bacterium]|nr:XdhC family protein [Mycobacteriales bacterium]